MKSKKWDKLTNGYTKLVILAIVSLVAGLSLLITPENTSVWVIRGVGLVWTLEGISYIFDIKVKHLENKVRTKLDNLKSIGDDADFFGESTTKK